MVFIKECLHKGYNRRDVYKRQDYDIRCQDPKFEKDRFREIMDIMLDAVCSTAPTIRINGEDMPQQVVKSRFLKLNSSHIEYVLEAMNKNPSDIRNIRAYLLTALYNASLTIDNYYSCLLYTSASTNVNRASGRLWLTARSIFPSVPRKRTRLPETAKSLRN